jgi:hypothetical protein
VIRGKAALGQACPGQAWFGRAWQASHGVSGCGTAGRGVAGGVRPVRVRRGNARHVQAWLGTARRVRPGEVWTGEFGCVMACHGTAGEPSHGGLGLAGRDAVGSGAARHGGIGKA